jgi:hypothetical protein
LTSQRVVDTSSLQSTKTLGRFKQAKKAGPPRQSDCTEDEADDVLNGNVDTEIISAPDIASDTISASPFESETPAIGCALKLPDAERDSKIKQTIKRRRLPPTWRERLEEAQIKARDSQLSERDDESASNNSDYSEWSGFSSDDSDHGETPQNTNNHSAAMAEAPISKYPLVDDDSSDSEMDLHHRTTSFKDWAREQSGLGPSISNISSLPPIPSRNVDLVAPARDIPLQDVKILYEPPKSQPVFLSPRSLTSGVFCAGPANRIHTTFEIVITDRCRGAKYNGNVE